MRQLALLALAVSLLGLGGAAPAAAQTGVNPAPAPPAPAPAQPAPQPPQPAQPAQAQPAAPSPQIEDKDVEQAEESSEGGSRNIVHIENHADNRFLLRGRADLAHVEGLNASPANHAEAFASCTDCQTYAIALQIAFIRTDATTIAPDNEAIAVNFQCLRCHTVARAVQYVFQVDDPNAIPDRARELIERMNDELKDIRQTRGLSTDEIDARVSAVITEFNDLAPNVNDKRQETDADNS